MKTRYRRLDSKNRTGNECILNSEPKTDEGGAYCVLGGNFMQRRFFREGKVRPGFFFPRGNYILVYFFRGDSIPGRFFREGKFYAGETLCYNTAEETIHSSEGESSRLIISVGLLKFTCCELKKNVKWP